jgi:RNA polymerase sigma factor (sigma-70 family)
MKIKYEFATETVEVEVTDEWATVIADLDRRDYNTKHKETRRHCSLEAYNLDGTLLPTDEDVERDFIRSEENKKLYAAIAQLEPRQQDLIRRVFFEGQSYSDIARGSSLHRTSVQQATVRALKKLKKLLQ